MILTRMARSIVQKTRKKKITEVGINTKINRKCTFIGQIHIGSNCSVGEGAYFVSSKANIYIHDYVLFGPNVTIYTGDHRTDVIGKHIIEVTDKEKTEENKYDKDVIIEAGCWVGTRTIILKGVTIGRGSVIGAGAIVTKDVPPYSIYVGTPLDNKIIARFTPDQVQEHEDKLRERGITVE